MGASTTTGFEGASTGRRLSAWVELDTAISALLAAEGDTLRRRCRGLVRKNHWARCAEDSYVANVIGDGIKPQSLHPDPGVRKKIHSLWKYWCDEADADGLTDFYGLQALGFREVFQAGEVFHRFRARYPEDGLIVPLQLQLIPSEHLPLTDARMANGKNKIRYGIEFTPFGKRAAYHLWREHPGIGGMMIGDAANEQVRVPADQVLHVFNPVRAGMQRGQPWLTPVMVTLYELDQFIDAVLVKQKISNMFVGWQKRQNMDDPLVGSEAEQGEDTADATAGPGVATAEIQGGTIWDLDEGDTLEFNEPPGPGAQFHEFLNDMLHGFAAGVGVPYGLVTWDGSQENFSSQRGQLLEFRRRVEQIQFGCVVFQMCRPAFRRWVNDAVLAGELPAPRNAQEWRDLYAVEWRTPKWAWVDPLKDVLAAKEAVRCGFDSRSGIIHEMGRDPEQVDEEIAADNARADQAGSVYDTDPRKTASSGAAQDFAVAETGGQQR